MWSSNWYTKNTFLVTVTAILSFLNGLAYLLFPSFSTGVLGFPIDKYNLHITKYYGACALGYGILLWLIRDIESVRISRAVLLSILVILGVSTVIGIKSQFDGVTNNVGFLFITTDFCLSIGALSLLIVKN